MDPGAKPLLYCIGGPTASGKTALGVELALKVGGAVISADSMQVYRFMDIGTAKPTPEEMRGVPHYMIDVLNPDETCSAALYKGMADECLKRAYESGRQPIIVGGTGFYINAVIGGVSFDGGPGGPGDSDENLRAELYAFAGRYGNAALHALLKEADEASFLAIHPNNVRRVVRALEYFRLTGRKISWDNMLARDKARAACPYDVVFIAIDAERRRLYERINARVDAMFERGLAEEVEWLLRSGYGAGLTSMQGLGYKETARYIKGEISLEEAKTAIKTGTRRYAKRQLTWFRRQCRADWVNLDEYGTHKIIQYIMKKGARS